MSPTSYQAAPPREGMIAEALEFVKPTCNPPVSGALDQGRRVRNSQIF
jgi:hypothetical protein